MALSADTQNVAGRFAQYTEELHEFFASHRLSFGQPEDLLALPAALTGSGTFRDELCSMVRSVILREGGHVPRTDLLTFVAVAVGGPQVAEPSPELARQIQEPLHLLLDLLTTVVKNRRNEPPQPIPPPAPYIPAQASSSPNLSPDVSSGPPTHPPDLQETLLRLELTNLEVKMYLGSIKERIERIEHTDLHADLHASSPAISDPVTPSHPPNHSPNHSPDHLPNQSLDQSPGRPAPLHPPASAQLTPSPAPAHPDLSSPPPPAPPPGIPNYPFPSASFAAATLAPAPAAAPSPYSSPDAPRSLHPDLIPGAVPGAIPAAIPAAARTTIPPTTPAAASTALPANSAAAAAALFPSANRATTPTFVSASSASIPAAIPTPTPTLRPQSASGPSPSLTPAASADTLYSRLQATGTSGSVASAPPAQSTTSTDPPTPSNRRRSTASSVAPPARPTRRRDLLSPSPASNRWISLGILCAVLLIGALGFAAWHLISSASQAANSRPLSAPVPAAASAPAPGGSQPASSTASQAAIAPGLPAASVPASQTSNPALTRPRSPSSSTGEASRSSTGSTDESDSSSGASSGTIAEPTFTLLNPKPPAGQPASASSPALSTRPAPAPAASASSDEPLNSPPPPRTHSSESPSSGSSHTLSQAPLMLAGSVMAQNLVFSRQPGYPHLATLAHIQGEVVVEALINRFGTVQEVHAISGHRLLRGAAEDAVRTWRYRPYLLNGHPVDVTTRIPIEFKLH